MQIKKFTVVLWKKQNLVNLLRLAVKLICFFFYAFFFYHLNPLTSICNFLLKE